MISSVSFLEHLASSLFVFVSSSALLSSSCFCALSFSVIESSSFLSSLLVLSLSVSLDSLSLLSGLSTSIGLLGVVSSSISTTLFFSEIFSLTL
jgi:hypothetical protein